MARKKKRHMSDFGSSDFFGLDEFGAADGKSGLIGIMIGGGVSTATALGLRAMQPSDSFFAKSPEFVGLLAGAAASAAYGMATKQHSAMWAGIATALFTNGIRAVEKLFGGGGLGMYAMPYAYQVPESKGLSGLGIHTVEPGYNVPASSGLSGPSLSGTLGSSLGAAKKPTLVGLEQVGRLKTAGAKVSLLGGPNIDGLGAHYGATLFGAQ